MKVFVQLNPNLKMMGEDTFNFHFYIGAKPIYLSKTLKKFILRNIFELERGVVRNSYKNEAEIIDELILRGVLLEISDNTNWSDLLNLSLTNFRFIDTLDLHPDVNSSLKVEKPEQFTPKKNLMLNMAETGVNYGSLIINRRSTRSFNNILFNSGEIDMLINTVIYDINNNNSIKFVNGANPKEFLVINVFLKDENNQTMYKQYDLNENSEEMKYIGSWKEFTNQILGTPFGDIEIENQSPGLLILEILDNADTRTSNPLYLATYLGIIMDILIEIFQYHNIAFCPIGGMNFQYFKEKISKSDFIDTYVIKFGKT